MVAATRRRVACASRLLGDLRPEPRLDCSRPPLRSVASWRRPRSESSASRRSRPWSSIGPEVRNALDRAASAELARAFRAFEADAEARVAVLTGAGGAFCSRRRSERARHGELYEPWAASADGPTAQVLSKPVIAAIEGAACAGGLGLALWCDLRVIDETAVFGVFSRRVRRADSDGTTVRLPRLIGLSRALDLLLDRTRGERRGSDRDRARQSAGAARSSARSCRGAGARDRGAPAGSAALRSPFRARAVRSHAGTRRCGCEARRESRRSRARRRRWRGAVRRRRGQARQVSAARARNHRRARAALLRGFVLLSILLAAAVVVTVARAARASRSPPAEPGPPDEPPELVLEPAEIADSRLGRGLARRLRRGAGAQLHRDGAARTKPTWASPARPRTGGACASERRRRPVLPHCGEVLAERAASVGRCAIAIATRASLTGYYEPLLHGSLRRTDALHGAALPATARAGRHRSRRFPRRPARASGWPASCATAAGAVRRPRRRRAAERSPAASSSWSGSTTRSTRSSSTSRARAASRSTTARVCASATRRRTVTPTSRSAASWSRAARSRSRR